MKFSIVITTYNRLNLLKRAIDSSLNQTVPAEVVVVDDGSSDGTEAYLQVYRDIYGEPAQPAPAPIVVKQTPELSPPPGNKKPAPVTQPDTTTPPLTRERMAAAERFASIGGVDPQRLIERQAKRIGGNRG